MHVVLIALMIDSHGAASSSRSSFDASNIERTARLVNEMAIHICGGRAGALLPRQALVGGFISLGRFGTADEVAKAVMLLVDNAYMTGQTIALSGGMASN
jgi:NAD(P)-dependent dehydrogenase (short-subunit alcohol dehydrogenase family)